MHTDSWRVTAEYSTAVVVRGSKQDGDLEIVAKAYSIEGHTDKDVARLIAAAPALLAALKGLLPWHNGTVQGGVWVDALAAIKQAEGGES